jgi:hypothetical protein
MESLEGSISESIASGKRQGHNSRSLIIHTLTTGCIQSTMVVYNSYSSVMHRFVITSKYEVQYEADQYSSCVLSATNDADHTAVTWHKNPNARVKQAISISLDIIFPLTGQKPSKK